jgi:hypothetical protein
MASLNSVKVEICAPYCIRVKRLGLFYFTDFGAAVSRQIIVFAHNICLTATKWPNLTFLCRYWNDIENDNGVQLIFVRQPELSTAGPHGKLLLVIYSYFAEVEREFIARGEALADGEELEESMSEYDRNPPFMLIPLAFLSLFCSAGFRTAKTLEQRAIYGYTNFSH